MASSDNTKIGDRTLPELLPGSQKSLKIFTEVPLPILQRAPNKITFQAYDPDLALASKMDPMGKYLSLNTL